MRGERTEADDLVQGAANRALLDLILPPMRRVARDCGYALAVHGSLCRDIDLIAVPWIEAAVDTDTLARKLEGAVAGVTGRCLLEEGWAEKPHGRLARVLMVWCGERTTHLDLSVVSNRSAKPCGA